MSAVPQPTAPKPVSALPRPPQPDPRTAFALGLALAAGVGASAVWPAARWVGGGLLLLASLHALSLVLAARSLVADPEREPTTKG